MQRATRYVIGIGLAVVLAFMALPRAVDKEGMNPVMVSFGPTYDPEG